MRSTIASAIPVSNARNLAGALAQMSSRITGPDIKTFALRTIKGPVNQWNHPVLLKSGEGPLISTTSRMDVYWRWRFLFLQKSHKSDPYEGTVQSSKRSASVTSKKIEEADDEEGNRHHLSLPEQGGQNCTSVRPCGCSATGKVCR